MTSNQIYYDPNVPVEKVLGVKIPISRLKNTSGESENKFTHIRQYIEAVTDYSVVKVPRTYAHAHTDIDKSTYHDRHVIADGSEVIGLVIHRYKKGAHLIQVPVSNRDKQNPHIEMHPVKLEKILEDGAVDISFYRNLHCDENRVNKIKSALARRFAHEYLLH